MNVRDTIEAESAPSRLHVTNCVVCGSTAAKSLWSVDRTPIHQFRPRAARGGKGGFGTLRIVRCASCGHLYNAAFDPSGADDLYGAFVLTNVPVSPSMVKAVEGTAELILAHAGKTPAILEIGGGGGALSILLSEQASEVHLVEPSRALSADRFAGTKVHFHQSMFPAASLGSRMFDVVVCRQVLEHVPDPAPFLQALRAQTNEGGLAYIELPSAEYIHAAKSVVDFHYPHVHYYSRPHLRAMFGRAGFSIIKTVDVKDGHDTAFLLRAVGRADMPAPTLDGRDDLGTLLAERRARGRERIETTKGAIGLYGANAYSQALFGIYPDMEFAAMFDDTPMYEGQLAYGPSTDIPIERPTAARLAELSMVLITAYLHDRTIAHKVRDFGFKGPIYSVRSDAQAGRGEMPASLFG